MRYIVDQVVSYTPVQLTPIPSLSAGAHFVFTLDSDGKDRDKVSSKSLCLS
jgi:hypothetical protein